MLKLFIVTGSNVCNGKTVWCNRYGMASPNDTRVILPPETAEGFIEHAKRNATQVYTYVCDGEIKKDKLKKIEQSGLFAIVKINFEGRL